MGCFFHQLLYVDSNLFWIRGCVSSSLPMHSTLCFLVSKRKLGGLLLYCIYLFIDIYYDSAGGLVQGSRRGVPRGPQYCLILVYLVLQQKSNSVLLEIWF